MTIAHCSLLRLRERTVRPGPGATASRTRTHHRRYSTRKPTFVFALVSPAQVGRGTATSCRPALLPTLLSILMFLSGQATFITASSSAAAPDAQQALRASLEEWLRAAEEAGLSDEAVTALIAVARHDMRKEKVP